MPWRGPSVPGEYPTLGMLALQWIEDNLLITEGPKIGLPFAFYTEQKRFVLRRYQLDPKAPADVGNDAFVFGGSQIIRGQKWGKDPILAALDLFHAFGPCCFAGYDADGNPVGEPHPSPWVGVAALNDLQANNTWLPLKAMVESSDLVDLEGVDVTLDSIRLPGGNPIERLTTTAFGRLGGRFTAVSLTENGLMTGTGEGGNTGKRSPLSFARTLLRSVGGMNGMWIAASNEVDPTENSHAQQIIEGKDPHTHVDVKTSRRRIDLDDDAGLDEEFRYLYGDSLTERGGHVSLQRLRREVRSPAAGENEVRRFFLSERLAGEEPFSTPERWAALERGPEHPEHDPLRSGEAITLGFDGSRARDKTVLLATRIRDGRAFPLRSWTPSCRCERPNHEPADCKTPKVPYLEVEQAIDDTFVGFKVWYLYGDPYLFTEMLERLSAKYPGRVVEVPTNVESRMDGMVLRWIAARDQALVTHDGHDELTQHVKDTVIAKGRRKVGKTRENAAGQRIEHYLKLAKKREGVFIDWSVALVLALAARGQAIEDGALTETPPPSPRSFTEPASTEPDAVDWNTVSF